MRLLWTREWPTCTPLLSAIWLWSESIIALKILHELWLTYAYTQTHSYWWIASFEIICKIEYWYSMKVNPRWNESESCATPKGGPHVALQEVSSVSWARAILQPINKMGFGFQQIPKSGLRVQTCARQAIHERCLNRMQSYNQTRILLNNRTGLMAIDIQSYQHELKCMSTCNT